MTTERRKLKLGKGTSFVKTRMKQLKQEDDTWEADFRTLPKSKSEPETHYLGLVVALPRGNPLVSMLVEYTPNVNDLADLLADAMRRPMTDSAHRPRRISLLRNPRWEELIPHLNQLGIEVAIQEELPKVEEVHEDFLRQLRRATTSPLILYTPSPSDVQRTYPAIATWVRGYGHIEIGDQQGFGFIVRAIDYGGQIFEDKKPSTLTEAMAVLEKGIAKWFQEQRIELPDRRISHGK